MVMFRDVTLAGTVNVCRVSLSNPKFWVTVGGVPAFFKAFTREAGLDYDVSLETVGGKGCFLKDNHSPFTKQVRHKLLIKDIDQAVVSAHQLQVDGETLLTLVRERLGFFADRKTDEK